MQISGMGWCWNRGVYQSSFCLAVCVFHGLFLQACNVELLCLPVCVFHSLFVYFMGYFFFLETDSVDSVTSGQLQETTADDPTADDPKSVLEQAMASDSPMGDVVRDAAAGMGAAVIIIILLLLLVLLRYCLMRCKSFTLLFSLSQISEFLVITHFRISRLRHTVWNGYEFCDVTACIRLGHGGSIY